MGNPKGVTTGPPLIGGDNGIFAAVSSDVIGLGAKQLPPADTARDQTRTIVVDGGHHGPVRITFVCRRYRHYRNVHWAWGATRVDPEPPLG